MFKIEFRNFGKLTIDSNWTPLQLTSLNKLYRVYGGRAYYGRRELLPGHLYLFPDHNQENLHGAENFDHLYFDFFIAPSLYLTDLIDLSLCDHPAISSVCDAASAVFTEYDKREIGDTAQALLTSLLLLCEKIVPLRATGDDRIDDAVGYICDHPDGNFNVDRLADIAHLEKCYFIKLFKSKTGKTPYRYACDLRLNNSVIIIEGGATIREAAEAAGYQSEAAFSGAFKKRFGIPPGKIKTKFTFYDEQ